MCITLCVKVGAAATAAVGASAIQLSEKQAIQLLGQECSKSTIAVNALRSTFAAGHRSGVNANVMSLNGRLAFFSVIVQAIGIYHTSLSLKGETDPGKRRDLQLAMADSWFGAAGGMLQMLTVATEAYQRTGAATPSLANTAIEKSKGLGAFRFLGALAGVAGGFINAYAMFKQSDKALNNGNNRASDLYSLSAIMFLGTAGSSSAVASGALASTLVANGSMNPALRKLASKGATVALVRVAGVTVLSASGIGWVLLIVGVGAQLAAVALTPSKMQRWVSRSYFGRDTDIFGRPAGRRSDSFPRGKWDVERAGLAEAMKESAKDTAKYLENETAVPLQAMKK